MRKLIFAALFLFLTASCELTAMPPALAATPKIKTVAVIMLGSLEFLNPDYYEIVTESWKKRFPDDRYRLFVGDYPQQLFNRFSDKQGLLPGDIPAEDKMVQFAWSHSFNEVIFLQLSAPIIKTNEITFQWETPEVTITARSLRFDARSRKKLSDATSTQTVKTFTRKEAKKASFRKCLETLRDEL